MIDGTECNLIVNFSRCLGKTTEVQGNFNANNALVALLEIRLRFLFLTLKKEYNTVKLWQ